MKPPLDHFSIVLPHLRPRHQYPSGYAQDAERREIERLGLGDFEGRRPDFIVMEQSPKVLRNAAETLAYYFRREERYDFVQYLADAHGGCRDRCFLFTPDRNYEGNPIVGAACFRWRDDYEDAPPCFAMAWVWLHPYERRQGILSRSWEYFRWRFGQFYLEPPLSEAMKAFVATQGGFPNPLQAEWWVAQRRAAAEDGAA